MFKNLSHYIEALSILNALVASDEIKVDSLTLREYIALYTNGLKVVYYKNRAVTDIQKMVKAQKKLNDLFDIGEFAAKMDANL